MNIIEKINLRDYEYTIISRFEETIRDYVYKCININYSNILDAIPKGVLKCAIERNCDNLDLVSILGMIDFIQLKEIIIYKNNCEIFLIWIMTAKIN